MEEFSEQEVTQALNQLVEEGRLKLIIKNGVPMYVENTYNAGYAQALKDNSPTPPEGERKG